MFTYEPMAPLDIFRLDLVNLDRKSENFTLDYYLSYLQQHPGDFITVQHRVPGLSAICGYIFGKLELKTLVCMHVSALSVAPAYRAGGLGTALLDLFEHNGNCLGAAFSDLYVRACNAVAIAFYMRNGYVIYRRVFDYYGGPVEDACDMRKPLLADPNGTCVVGGHDIHGSFL